MRLIKHIFVAFLVLILFWQIVYWIGGFQDALFPAPCGVGKALIEMITKDHIYKDIAASLYRFFIGYSLAAASAIALGLFFGCFPRIFAYANPIVQLIRPISPIAWLPFLVLWVGIGDAPAIVVIFLAAFFPVLLSTTSAVGNIDLIYRKIAQNFEIRALQKITKIIIPAAFPQISNSLHLALGSAWVFLVAGEMSGSQSGLGFLIIDARNNLRTDLLLGTILIIGMIGLLLDQCIKLIEARILLRWGVDKRERR